MKRDTTIPFHFESYEAAERERLDAAIRNLATMPAATSPAAWGILLPLTDSWLRGSAEAVLERIDDVMRKMVKVGERFTRAKGREAALARRFYWKVEASKPKATCGVDIGLVLVSMDPGRGDIILTQQVLRLGEDEFAYWGVD